MQKPGAYGQQILKPLKKIFQATDGQDLIEYGLIAAFLAAIAVTVLGGLGIDVRDVYQRVAGTTQAARDPGSDPTQNPGSGNPGNGNPGNGNPGNGNPGNGNPGNANPGNGNPGNGNPGNGNPGNGNPGNGNPGNGNPGNGNPGNGNPGNGHGGGS